MSSEVEKLDKSLFELVQQDKKIHDTKFETKATSFAKDAFKRFYKNKSSVIGAVIIAIIILLSIFIPASSPYNIESTPENLMPAKLFEAGTGFWDGTQKRQNEITVELPDGKIIPKSLEEFNEEKRQIALMGREITTYEKDGIILCDYILDVYAIEYGTYEDTIDFYFLEKYKFNKWINYDKEVLDETHYKIINFKVLDDQSPVREIDENKVFDTYNVTGKIDHAKLKGYNNMPKFVFGTDNSGRDLLTLTFSALRISLILAVIVSAVCFTIGIVWGSISGYFGGNIDIAMERFCEILGGLPYLAVVTLFTLHLGLNIGVFILALCFSGWLGVAGRTRTQFYRFKGREYVLASRTLGAKDTRLIFKHILPNALGTIVTSSVLMIPGVMFSESTLAYLGLKIGDYTSFGQILSENQGFLETAPLLVMFPAIILSLLMISFNLFGNGLRDALNPSLKGSE